MKAEIYNSTEGEILKMGGNTYWFQVLNNNWTVFTAEADAGMAPPIHFHKDYEEIVIVTKGEFVFKLDDEYRVVGEGGIVFIPRMVVHGFRSTVPGSKAIGIFNRPNVDGYFKEIQKVVAESGDKPPSPQQVGALGDKYDFQVVGPPLSPDVAANVKNH